CVLCVLDVFSISLRLTWNCGPAWSLWDGSVPVLSLCLSFFPLFFFSSPSASCFISLHCVFWPGLTSSLSKAPMVTHTHTHTHTHTPFLTMLSASVLSFI